MSLAECFPGDTVLSGGYDMESKSDAGVKITRIADAVAQKDNGWFIFITRDIPFLLRAEAVCFNNP